METLNICKPVMMQFVASICLVIMSINCHSFYIWMALDFLTCFSIWRLRNNSHLFTGWKEQIAIGDASVMDGWTSSPWSPASLATICFLQRVWLPLPCPQLASALSAVFAFSQVIAEREAAGVSNSNYDCSALTSGSDCKSVTGCFLRFFLKMVL